MDHMPNAELAGLLQHAKKEIQKIAWALCLHVPGGPTGSRHEVEGDAYRICAWLEEASKRLIRDGAREQ